MTICLEKNRTSNKTSRSQLPPSFEEQNDIDTGDKIQPFKKAKIVGKFPSLPLRAWIQQNGIDVEEDEINGDEDIEQDSSDDEEADNEDEAEQEIDVIEEENNKTSKGIISHLVNQ